MSTAGATLMALAGASATIYFPPASRQPSVRCAGHGVTAELCGYAVPDRACRAAFGKDKPAVSKFENEWFSKHLAAANEPVLFQPSRRLIAQGRSVLRFTWLRSFHAPVVVRVAWSARSHPRLFATELTGKGGYEPGAVRRRSSRNLSSGESAALRRAIDAARLSSAPGRECDLGTDGAEWIFETVSRDGYRVVTRQSPGKGDIRALGLHLIRLTGWDVGEVY